MNNANYNNINVVCPEDCGNAPKKVVLKEFIIALAKKDISFILENVSDDILWNKIGCEKIEGKDHFAEALQQINDSPVWEIQISNIITHGRSGAVNGTLLLEDNRKLEFCDVYMFTSAGKNSKIKEMTSYVIEIG
ncbi:nuclear transport factor 2 family protein [uncultured Metabacillus sp.]|uniref:nuclear transport factor 2 family protein n=1 Tax=uncultured Metabacillus sp. TaxID=2860135 RepID=UPI0026327AB7|nr:nuclear transport factor 2 family protein [uncultured Metabacillus sp.]